MLPKEKLWEEASKYSWFSIYTYSNEPLKVLLIFLANFYLKCICFYISELKANADLISLNGKTLTVTSGPSPKDVSSSDSLLCPYVNLQLMNASPAGILHFMSMFVCFLHFNKKDEKYFKTFNPRKIVLTV